MNHKGFRLISWNIGGRVKANRQQAQALEDRSPDIVALQEVRLNALKHFEAFRPHLRLPKPESN